jgi:hypothetical protein
MDLFSSFEAGKDGNTTLEEMVPMDNFNSFFATMGLWELFRNRKGRKKGASPFEPAEAIDKDDEDFPP